MVKKDSEGESYFQEEDIQLYDADHYKKHDGRSCARN